MKKWTSATLVVVPIPSCYEGTMVLRSSLARDQEDLWITPRGAVAANRSQVNLDRNL